MNNEESDSSEVDRSDSENDYDVQSFVYSTKKNNVFHLKPNFYYNNSNPIDEYGQYPLEQKVMEMSDKKEDW